MKSKKKNRGIVGKRLKELFDIERTVNKNPDQLNVKLLQKN